MGNYERAATSKTPALVIYLIDISGSMSEPFENGKRIDYVNRALTSTLLRMIQRSTKGAIVSPRYRLAMSVYSDKVWDMLGGIETIDAVAERGNPTLTPTHTTDTYAAFAWARDLLRQELPRLTGMPAPMVCHLTDGEYTKETGDPEPIAREIMAMSNDDGHVLVENIFVGPNLTHGPIGTVENWPGVSDAATLRSPYAQKLFQMSSSLPESYAQMMSDDGYSLSPGSRMLIPGSNSELIELAFTMSTSTPRE